MFKRIKGGKKSVFLQIKNPTHAILPQTYTHYHSDVWSVRIYFLNEYFYSGRTYLTDQK